MIDPHNITNYNMTDDELQEWFLFSVAVAGKTAVVIAKSIDKFIELARAHVTKIHQRNGWTKAPGWEPVSPLGAVGIITASDFYVTHDDELTPLLRKAKLGKYRVLRIAYSEAYARQSRNRNFLRTAPVSELEEIYGVGPKTARMFVMHSRPNQQVAALDTHVLHYLRDCGYNAPKNTPSSKKKYAKLEALFIRKAAMAGMSVADFDLKIWRKYTKTKAINGTESTTRGSGKPQKRSHPRAGRAGKRQNVHAH